MSKKLSEIWLNKCMELWDKEGLDSNDITLWDAFRFLYAEKTLEASGKALILKE